MKWHQSFQCLTGLKRRKPSQNLPLLDSIWVPCTHYQFLSHTFPLFLRHTPAHARIHTLAHGEALLREINRARLAGTPASNTCNRLVLLMLSNKSPTLNQHHERALQTHLSGYILKFNYLVKILTIKIEKHLLTNSIGLDIKRSTSTYGHHNSNFIINLLFNLIGNTFYH